MEQNKHEDNSLQNLRNKVQEFWEDGRLDEDYMRESRNLCLQADEVRMESLISRALLTRNNEKFLKLINLGLPLNYSSFGNFSANILYRQKYLPSFLNQAINNGDLERVEMLLAAGVKPEIDPLYPFEDSLAYCILSKKHDFNIFATVLSFIDEPIKNHWAFTYFSYLREKGDKWVIEFAELFILKLEEQGTNIEKFVDENTLKYKLIFDKNNLVDVVENTPKNEHSICTLELA